MRVRITDVAKRAGVSTTTASEALNGKGRVNPATQERIRRVANELGYTANAHAVSLKMGKTQLLAIQIGRPGPQGALVPAATYFNELINGISTEAFERGWTPVIVPRGAGIRDINRLYPNCGIVIDPIGQETLIEALVARGAPVMTTGRLVQRTGTDEIYSVDNDAIAVTHTVLQHFRDSGYKRPALLVSDTSASYVVDSISAATSWGESSGDDVLIYRVRGLNIGSVQDKMHDVLSADDRPDAVYATDQDGALGTLRAAQLLGLSVPDDLGISCGLDSPSLEFSNPPITAVDIQPGTTGRCAVSRLIELIENGVVGCESGPVPFNIRVRRSSSPSQHDSVL